MKVVVFSLSLIFAVSTFAAQKKQDPQVTMARATASFVNRMSNVEEYLATLDKNVSKEQMEKFRKQLSLNGINFKSKFPKMKYDGNKAYFDKKNFIIYVDDSTVNVNGVEIKKGVKNIDVVYSEVMSAIKKKNASHFYLLPEAHAVSDLGGVMGMVATGALGFVLGPSLGVSAGLGAVLGAGAFFLANEAWQWFRDGSVSCGSNGEFLVRKKIRPGLFATNEQQVLGQESLAPVFGGQAPPCNGATLSMYKNGINNYANAPVPVGNVPYNGSNVPVRVDQQLDSSGTVQQ